MKTRYRSFRATVAAMGMALLTFLILARLSGCVSTPPAPANAPPPVPSPSLAPDVTPPPIPTPEGQSVSPGGVWEDGTVTLNGYTMKQYGIVTPDLDREAARVIQEKAVAFIAAAFNGDQAAMDAAVTDALRRELAALKTENPEPRAMTDSQSFLAFAAGKKLDGFYQIGFPIEGGDGLILSVICNAAEAPTEPAQATYIVAEFNWADGAWKINALTMGA